MSHLATALTSGVRSCSCLGSWCCSSFRCCRRFRHFCCRCRCWSCCRRFRWLLCRCFCWLLCWSFCRLPGQAASAGLPELLPQQSSSAFAQVLPALSATGSAPSVCIFFCFAFRRGRRCRRVLSVGIVCCQDSQTGLLEYHQIPPEVWQKTISASNSFSWLRPPF